MALIFIAATFFVIFLELSGQLLLEKLKIQNYSLSLGIGLLVLMAYCYITTSIFTALNCSFWLVFIIYIAYLLTFIYLIIRNIGKVKYKFNLIDWLIVSLIVLVLTYYSKETTLGDLTAYDTTFYLNMITSNIKAANMNSVNVLYGGYGNTYVGYTFQSYYYFASVFVYLTTRIIGIFSKIDYATVTIWLFQILYFIFFSSLLVNALRRLKNKNHLVAVFILIVYVFFYGKLYYNSVFGFYGNTYRTIAIAYSMMTLYDLFKEQISNNWILFGVCLIGSCAFSSTSLFELIFILFGSFFILIDKEDNFFKYTSLILFFPLINLLSVSLYLSIKTSIIISIIFSITLYLSNNVLVKVFRKKYSKHVILFSVTILMFLLSYKVTNNIFDFSAFNNNLSERYDMTIDYTKIVSSGWNLKKLFCVISVSLLGFSLIINHKDDLIKFFWILIIAIFNPFCCSYLNSINMVYYRAYEIILNPFTITIMSEMFVSLKDYQIVNRVIMILVLFLFIRFIDFDMPSYWHTSFVPTEDYNETLKMTNDEYDVISFIKEDAEYRDNNSPYIVTTNILTEAYITNGRYMYCREYKINSEWNDAEKELHSLFHGSLVTEKLDNLNLSELIKESCIDYLVMDKKQEYYDMDNDIYNYFYRYVSECGYGYSIYENDNYVIFFFER